ncbi:MAG: ABC transporter permease [Lachnospiraceae bacterium]|nr:ABC transporter permease [Lachnospiraceae bacterium]
MTTAKKKHIALLPKMAVSNIRKNTSTYLPYMGVSTFAMFTYFVFDLILKNDIMYTLPKGTYTLILVLIGFWLLGIIMVPFLYYNNSFLIKRRKKELGLYSMLGLEKKHIGIMMFWESLIIYFCVMAAAICLGLVFSRLIFLLLLNLARMQVDVQFSVSPAAVTDSLLFYAFVTALNLTVNLVQVGKANPVELMGDSRKGEKEPRHIFVWSILGACALGAGYSIALSSQLDVYVFTDFFLAVLLVILGTYFLFTSGSIAALRFLKRRKKFYYRADHFITVSGMLYRMKKSAASLSNICVFSTMVIITAVCTVVVYLDMDTIVKSGIRRTFEFICLGDAETNAAGLREEAGTLAKQNRVTLEEELLFGYVELRAVLDGDAFLPWDGSGNDVADLKYLMLMTAAEYEWMAGTSLPLAPEEAVVFSTGADFASDRILFPALEYQVKEELTECPIDKKASDNRFSNRYLAVLSDETQVEKVCAAFGIDRAGMHSCFYGFELLGQDGDIDAFSLALGQRFSAVQGFLGYQDHRTHMADQKSMYGGLLFIGIFFGAIFLICLLIIMYYKQLTEGFEDQKNFEVMQQVGMSDSEIRHAIRTQISIVFGLPLLGAIVHTAVGMRMVYMLLGAIGFFELPLLVGCTAAGCLVFALIYGVSYKQTSMAYYKIVRHMN